MNLRRRQPLIMRPAVAAQAVAQPAYRLQRADPEGPVDLLSQVAHVHLDDVRALLIAHVPHRLQQLQLSEHATRVANERLKQRILARRQLELDLAAPRAVRRGIDPQVSGAEHRRPLHGSAPRQRPEPRQQLGERERLRQIVVGAGVQTPHAVLDRVTRREHDDRRPKARGPQPPAHLEAIRPRQHHIEDHCVEVRRAREQQCLLAVAGDLRDPAVAPQTAPDGRCHPRVVLDHQHAHRSMMTPWRNCDRPTPRHLRSDRRFHGPQVAMAKVNAMRGCRHTRQGQFEIEFTRSCTRTIQGADFATPRDGRRSLLVCLVAVRALPTVR